MKTIQLFIIAFCLPLFAFAGGEGESYSVTFSPQGWATFNSDKAVTVPDGVNVYIVTVSKDGATGNADYVATLHLVDLPMEDSKRYIPAHERGINPVVLKGTGTITLEVIEGTVPQNLYTTDQSDGLLCGTDDANGIVDANGNYHTYVLGYTENLGIGFYEVAPGKEIPANRAYIQIATAYSNSRIRVEIDNNPTSIHSASQYHATTGDRIYDLFGREITSPQRGQVYIKNNHKFIQE